mgnify:CR=1 FL=1
MKKFFWDESQLSTTLGTRHRGNLDRGPIQTADFLMQLAIVSLKILSRLKETSAKLLYLAQVHLHFFVVGVGLAARGALFVLGGSPTPVLLSKVDDDRTTLANNLLITVNTNNTCRFHYVDVTLRGFNGICLCFKKKF